MTARKQTDTKNASHARELVITRTLDAPRNHVWRLFTDPEHASQWWGPKNFTLSALQMDQRVGGRWRAVIRSPEGQELPQSGVYREIVPPERLAFTFTWESEGPESEMLCTFTFHERGTKTEMTFRKGPFATAESHDSERDGWNECFDRLVEYLERSPVGASQR